MSYEYSLLSFGAIHHLSTRYRLARGKKENYPLLVQIEICFRSSRCEGRIERTSSALTRRRSCGYEFGVVEFAVKTMRRVLLRARALEMIAKKKHLSLIHRLKSSSRLCNKRA